MSLESNGLIHQFDLETGQLIPSKQNLENAISKSEHSQVHMWNQESLLNISSDTGTIHKSWYGIYLFDSEVFAEIDRNDEFLKQDDKGVWFSNAREVFYIPTGKWRKRDRIVVWQIKSFGENMLLVNQDGHYLGFGEYQRYFHLQRDDVMIPWEDAEQSYRFGHR